MAGALVALLSVAIAAGEACGRRRGGGNAGAAFYGASSAVGSCGCDAAGAIYHFGAWQPAGAFTPAWSSPALSAPTVMPAPGLSAGSVRAASGHALYAIDPATGVLRQVGWMGADGTLRPLGANAGNFGALPAPANAK